MQAIWRNSFSFLHSRSYYLVLLVAAVGVQIDYALTIHGLSLGFEETRPLFWLHLPALFGLLTLMFALAYPFNRVVASRFCLALAIAIPSLPILSNVLVLTVGESPFV